MSIATIRGNLANWRNWEFNPVVIKELRQAVRSWTVTGMLLLFLTVLFITSTVFLVMHVYESDPGLGLGGSMFQAFLTILAAASVIFIPLYMGIRIAVERQPGNPDLLYVSTLSPARIIRGKFFCGAYMALLFFSACTPFMAFTNLLRGVDLPSVLFVLLFLFLVVCAANMVAIFLACLPVSRPFKVLLFLYGFFQSFALIMPVIALSINFLQSGVGAMLFGGGFWWEVISFMCITTVGAGLFYVLAIALISPPSANRALPVRLYITAAWIVTGGVAFAVMKRSGSTDAILVWVYPSVILMVATLLVTISNSDHPGVRVRRAIPVSPGKRAAAFLFFNGAAGGLLWVAAILGGTYFAATAMISHHSAGAVAPVMSDDFYILPTLMAYAFDYALSALFIHRTFFSRRPPKFAGLLAVCLASVWAIAPTIVLFFLNKLTWQSAERLQLGNIFNAMTFHDPYQRMKHLYFAFGWLALALVLNVRWFVRQARAFRPPPPGPPVNE